MKPLDLLKLSFTNARRTKSSYLIMILILIASVSCLFSLSYKNSFNKYWEDYVKNSPEFRIMTVFYENRLDSRIFRGDTSLDPLEKLKMIDETIEEVMNILSQNEHILGVSTQYRSIATIDYFEQFEGEIFFSIYGAPLVNNIPIILGENLDIYTENDKVMICPNIVYFSDENNVFDGNHNIDIKHLLNETVSVKVLNTDDLNEYKIIGFYDTISNYSYGQVCYTSYANAYDLDVTYYNAHPNLYQEHLEYMKTRDYTGDNVYIMIDDVNNLDEINDFLHENNMFQEGAVVGINTETVDEVMKNCSYITLGMLLLSGIIICLTLIQSISKRSKEFYLYSTLGYSKKDILKLIFVENSILILIGYIFAIITTQIGLTIFKNAVLVHKSRLYLMNPSVDVISILIGLLVALTIPILITITLSIFTRKKKFSFTEE